MHKSDEQGCLCAAALNFIGKSSLTTAVTLHITQKQLQPKAAVNPHTARYTADRYKVRTSQEQDNIERTLASGRRPAPTPLRRPWRSWAPPIFGNVFCPEDLEDHYHHQYYPQGLTRAQAQQQLQLQHQQQQEEADHLSAEALVPANSLFCGQPSLVLSPDGCEIAVARRLKQTSYSTEISTQNSSYQPKVSERRMACA